MEDSASLVVQCGQTGCRRAQDDVSLGSYGRGDDFHQESLAPPRSAVYVHQQWSSKSHRFNDLLVDRPLFARCQQGQVRIQILLAAASVPSQAFSWHFSRGIDRFWQAEVRHQPWSWCVPSSPVWTYPVPGLVSKGVVYETTYSWSWVLESGHYLDLSR